MASGNRRIRINTQERAVSSDINRLQQFANQDFGEFLRLLLNVQTSDIDPGTVTEATTIGTPLSAEIVNGLLVRPVAGNFSLTVDPGLLGALAPDAAADDSNYKYIRDPGIPSAGVLAIGANASGSIRIDVIECRVNPVEATVSDSRDIFDSSTGLFSATSVTKEIKGQLEYRVRAGTGGSGYPTAQSGWMPLCVASVPNGAASNDTVTFWDVRPMLADRAASPMNHVIADQILTMDDEFISTGGVRKFVGTATAIHNGRRVGGRFKKTVPGTATDFLDVYDVTNQDTGTIAVGVLTGNVHVYCVTPFGLPRWARYTDGPSGRVPEAPKGLLVCSLTPPTRTGAPSTAIALPVGTGLGGTTSDAICVEVARWFGNAADLFGSRTVKKCQMGGNPILIAGAYNVLSATRADFHVRDQDWPPNAKYALVALQIGFTLAAGAQQAQENSVLIWNTNDMSGLLTEVDAPVATPSNISGAPVAYVTTTGTLRLPPPNEAGTPAVSPRLVQWELATAVPSPTAIDMLIYGFEF